MTTFSSDIPLTEPVARGETKIESVKIRKPKAGELRGLQMNALIMGDVNQHLQLLPRITTPPLLEHEISDLDPSDLSEMINEALLFLLPKGVTANLPNRSQPDPSMN